MFGGNWIMEGSKLINEWVHDEWILIWRTTVRSGNHRRQDWVGGRVYTTCFFIYSLCFTTNFTLLCPSALVLYVTPGLETTELGDYGLIQWTKSVLLPLSCSSQVFFFQWQKAEKHTDADDIGTRGTKVTLWGQKQQDQYIAKTLFTNTITKVKYTFIGCPCGGSQCPLTLSRLSNVLQRSICIKGLIGGETSSFGTFIYSLTFFTFYWICIIFW